MWIAAAILGVLAGAGLGVLWFNRDPQRSPPEQPSAILAPADGVVVVVEQIAAARWLEGPVWHIAIFLNLNDVHVQRTPAGGVVSESEWQTGGHKPALYASASTNAGHWLKVDSVRGPVVVLRTAGLIARRVTSYVAAGDELAAGQRIGRILLGSRTEVYVPASVTIRVKPGERVYAGESIIAHWPEVT